jgi:hypothetical protein
MSNGWKCFFAIVVTAAVMLAFVKGVSMIVDNAKAMRVAQCLRVGFTPEQCGYLEEVPVERIHK